MEEVAYRGLTGCALLREQPNVALLSEYNLDRKLICRMPLCARTTFSNAPTTAPTIALPVSRARVWTHAKKLIALNAVSLRPSSYCHLSTRAPALGVSDSNH